MGMVRTEEELEVVRVGVLHRLVLVQLDLVAVVRAVALHGPAPHEQLVAVLFISRSGRQ